MAKSNRNIKTDILWRVGVILVLFIVFAITVLGKIVYLDLFKSEELLAKAVSFSYKDIIIEPSRGDIKSSDGALLATTLPKYEIRFDLLSPSITQDIFNSNVDSLSYYLAELFQDKEKQVYKSDLVAARKAKKRYYLIKRNISFPQLQKLKSFPIFRKGKYKGGLIVLEKSIREKPFGLLASRSVGFLIDIEDSNRKRGYVGLERTYENELRGEQGVGLFRRLSKGRIMPVDEQVEPIDGLDVITTIDIRFQDIVEEELMKAMHKYLPAYGTAVLMEVETGKIKAIANLDKGIDGAYYESYNHAIGSSFEPGSTFKLASLIVALEDGVVNLTDTIDIENGKKKYYDKLVKDDHVDKQLLSVQEVFEVSSNVGVTKIIVENYKNDPRKFIERLYSMNLNEKLGLEIKGEGKPLIKYPTDETWSGVSLPWMSMGYELQMTPMQILNFYNAVANNGKMLRPRFVNGIEEHGKIIKNFPLEVINSSICSKSTITKAQKMLKGVVEKGTAKNISSEDLSISGKTGTALIAKEGTYRSKFGKTYVASFVGYFPSDKPKYSCIVVVNSPSRGGFYGSGVAAPVFKKIANKVYAMSLDIIHPINEGGNRAQIPYAIVGNKEDILNIIDYNNFNYSDKTETSNWLRANVNDSVIDLRDRFVATNRIPDVRGMGLRDALFVLENVGLQVRARGTGKVRRQSLSIGRNFKQGEKILIELS